MTLEIVKAELEAGLKQVNAELKGWMEKAEGQLRDAGQVNKDVKDAIDAMGVKSKEIFDRLASLEQKAGQVKTDADAPETIGAMLVKSDQFKALQQGRARAASIEIKTAIVNATGQNQPLVPSARVPGIIEPARRMPRVRDLFPRGVTSSNLVEFAKTNVITNNAGPQYSSPNYENVTKPESGVTFTLASAAVTTLAHFIPASKQVLSDSPMLQSYIEGLLMYGLMLEEEDQLLNGNGTSGNLSGVLNSGNFTAYSAAVSGDTDIDTIRRAIGQLQGTNNMPNAIVLNPANWTGIELTKTDDNAYVFANPTSMAGPMLWGLPVIATNAITAGTFLVGDFAIGAQVWDREQASVSVSLEDGTNFQKNMVTILAEERLALTVYRPSAFVSGSI
jgi:HK97 family phage major capsid protein